MNKKNKLDNGYRLDDFGLLFSDEKSKKREKSILLRKKDAESSLDSAELKSTKSISHSEQGEESQKKNNRDASHPTLHKNGTLFSVLHQNDNILDSTNSQNLQAELPRRFAEYARNDDFLDATKSAESNIPPQKSQSKKLKEQDFIYAPQFQGFDEILDESKDFSAQDSNTQDSNAQKQSAESSPKSQISPQSEKDLLLRHPHTQNDTNALFIAYSILFLMLLAFMPQIYLANNIYTSSKNINLLKAQKDALRDENSDLQKQLESVKFNFLTLEIEEIK